MTASKPGFTVIPIHSASPALPAIRPIENATAIAPRQFDSEIVTSDQLGRNLQDLRISVTDRCNFRCGYCMPREAYRAHRFLPHTEVLTFEETTRIARLCVALGVRKIRVTGGEPLLRRDLPKLIAMLAQLRDPAGHPIELALTTNGVLLAQYAQALYDAGLQRITVSVDALDEKIFKRMSDAPYSVQTVLRGIEVAEKIGFRPIKVNTVVQRGLNTEEVIPLARYFRGTGIEVRFIEFMDVGMTNQWDWSTVVSANEIIQQVHAQFPLTPLAKRYPQETAERWCYQDGAGVIGVIPSVTQAFCGTCSRVRLSTNGQLYLCLFAQQGFDLRQLLRSQQLDDEQLQQAIATIWHQRNDRYSELRPYLAGRGRSKIEMSYIGG